MPEPFKMAFVTGMALLFWWWAGSTCYSLLTSLPVLYSITAAFALVAAIWAVNLRDLYPHEKLVALGIVVVFIASGTATAALSGAIA